MYELNAYCGQQSSIIITKPNTLVEASCNLTMAEYDLITLAINKLYLQKSDSNQVIISGREFATANRVSSTYAYRVLKDCAESLPNKKLAVTLYKDLSAENTDELLVVRPNHSKYKTIATECHWVQNATYVEQTGFITLYFSDLVRHIISNTGKAYTKYDYLKTIDFKGCSTKRLYELVLKWKDIGKTPTMTIYEWKEYLGYIDSYPEVSEFRRRVLDYGLKQINAQGDFEVTLDPTRLGRSFTHFSMIIKKLKSSKLNHTSKDNSNNSVKLLSPKQADMFANLLANDNGFGSRFARAGEAMAGFTSRISQDLQRDLGKIGEYMPYLVRAGFEKTY